MSRQGLWIRGSRKCQIKFQFENHAFFITIFLYAKWILDDRWEKRIRLLSEMVGSFWFMPRAVEHFVIGWNNCKYLLDDFYSKPKRTRYSVMQCNQKIKCFQEKSPREKVSQWLELKSGTKKKDVNFFIIMVFAKYKMFQRSNFSRNNFKTWIFHMWRKLSFFFFHKKYLHKYVDNILYYFFKFVF